MWRGRVFRRFVALLSISVTATVLPLGQAGADTVASKQAEAAKIAAQIDADEHRVDSLTARFEAAQLAESDANARLADAAVALRTVRVRIDQTKVAVRDLAVSEFMRGRRSTTPLATLPGAGDLRGSLTARLYADLAVSKNRDVLDANNAAQEDYQVRLRLLDAEQKHAHDVAASLQAARAAAERAVADQQGHLSKVRGDLAALVAAEQARREAAREARARATVSPNVTPRLPGHSGGTTGQPVDGSRAAAA